MFFLGSQFKTAGKAKFMFLVAGLSIGGIFCIANRSPRLKAVLLNFPYYIIKMELNLIRLLCRIISYSLMCLGLMQLCKGVQTFTTAESCFRVLHKCKRQIVPLLNLQCLIDLWANLLAYRVVFYYFLYWAFQFFIFICLPIYVFEYWMTFYLSEIVVP